ncbi:biopolymer transport protein ExbD/TolR [Sulfuricella denitrificans skB26]|uniref:Biopolymer transport protein ExbD/TolR n=1 Tax=Sulfuricella denitrificans (strain DSM 22764 / NBRC 105220 / skB26) TaxID=1163617 RepID=S6AAE2_SULDS|nr:biopolymer transporter ExbD [Sulfuricella denitrificans]BAN35705.1 biopolymer transport protein ExbD/TolR [Sulfuricella denitrificans skB26]
MNFQRGRAKDDPEINLIPMIDVLLVILIFMMVTTTFSQIAELQINLPTAEAEKPADKPAAINVAVDAGGRYMVNGSAVADADTAALSLALRRAAGDKPDPVIIINADAKATHQAVVNVMEAARQSGYSHITFATQAKLEK